MALDFRTFGGPIAKLSRNLKKKMIIIDIHFLENISAVVWIRSGKKPRTIRKVGFGYHSSLRKTGPVDPQSQGGSIFFLTQGFQYV